MRLRVIVAAIVTVVGTVAVHSGPAYADLEIGDGEGKNGGGGLLPLPTVGPPYCDLDGFPQYHWKPIGDYYATDTGTIYDEMGTSDGTPVYLRRLVGHYCSDVNGSGLEKWDVFWVSIVTPDTVVYLFDLYTQVKEKLPDPKVTWKDLDADHGWLWVNVEHHVGIKPVKAVSASQTAGNFISGYATAWVKATPAELTIEIPDAPDMDFENCDLSTARSAGGCRLRFTHSSSISPDAVFHGKIKMRWDVTSNSGKYNGRVITTESDFEIAVAEAMAVGGS